MDHHYEEQHFDEAHHVDDVLEPVILFIIGTLLVGALLVEMFVGARSEATASAPDTRPAISKQT